MSSEGLSEQSCVREGASYDEVYPLGQDDPSTSYDKRVPSANSPFMNEDEDLDVDELESDSNDEKDIGNDESPIQSVIGPDGLWKFIMLPLWTVNGFNSSIRQKHFNTLREKYQIPVGIPIRLPFKFEKCYYQDAEDIGMYKQMLKAKLRFPLSALHRRLLQYLGLAVTQISLNAWRVFLSVEVLYIFLSDRAHRMTMEEFFHCHRPFEIVQSKGMYSFLSKGPSLRLVCETPDSYRNWKSRYFFIQGDGWMCHPDDQKYMPVDKT